MKATVYRISGAVVSANYIQLPKATSQSLGLTGRFLYLLFRPLPSKFFSIHLEVATVTGLTVRISLSNIFKEFKATSTWLQFPLSLLRPDPETRVVAGEKGREAGQKRVKPKKRISCRWTLLVLDLRAVLTRQLSAEFAYLKNIQLCANLLMRGVFTSHSKYSPLPGGGPAHLEPLPREMRFPLGKTDEFSELYDYVRFPPDSGGECLPGCVEGRGGRERHDNHRLVGVVSVNSEAGEGVGRRRGNKNNGEPNRAKVSLSVLYSV